MCCKPMFNSGAEPENQRKQRATFAKNGGCMYRAGPVQRYEIAVRRVQVGESMVELTMRRDERPMERRERPGRGCACTNASRCVAGRRAELSRLRRFQLKGLSAENYRS